MRNVLLGCASAIALLSFATAGQASQLNYTFVNPTFGGSGLNGNYLLSTAQGQGYGAKSGAAANPVDLSGLSGATSGSSTVANPTGTTTTP